MNTNVLMIVGDFVEDYEAAVPIWILESHGIRTITASPGRRAGDRVITAIHDFDGQQTYCERRGHDLVLSSDWPADPLSFDGLILPGGRAPEFLQLDDRVLKLCSDYAASGRPIAALCHGLQILAAAGLVQDRKVTGYPGVKPQLIACGGSWQDPGPGLDRVCIDRNLVTGPAWPALGRWMAAFIQLVQPPR